MNQSERAEWLARLHVKGNPLLLYNAWDAGSAKVIAESGAKAIATSSWSMAQAQGYPDGEAIPFAYAREIVARIATSVDLPVTVDFEGGYSEDDSALAQNVASLLDTGISGINFEDRRVRGKGLFPIDRQATRIAVIREVARKRGIELFLNARCDLFFGDADHSTLIGEALDRAKAYAHAGASGFFVPGLMDDALIGHLCERIELPINVMVVDGISPVKRLAALGVARVSYGPVPYVRLMKSLREQADAMSKAASLHA
jgi:2-methylisocitrate lyase-like PEP mutase family enzyme